MNNSLSTKENYKRRIYNIVIEVAPLVGLLAGATFTVAKALGYYANTSWIGVIIFDIICCSYVLIAHIGDRMKIEKNGQFNNKAYTFMKFTVMILVAFQWNIISYIFPTEDFWAYAPLFLIIVAFFYDGRLIIAEAVILIASIIISWILEGKILLPDAGIDFNENLILRIVCILISFALIYLMARISEKALEELSEQSDMFRRMTIEEKKLGRLVDVVSAHDEKKVLDGMTILLVDDNQLTRELDADILQEEGAFVTVASSGEEAVEAFKGNIIFDAILIDLIMPGMSGIEATRKIRKLENSDNGKIPIIGITGSLIESQVEEMLRAGATDCLSKPLVVTEFARVLIAAMKENTLTVGMKLEETKHLANTDGLTKVKNVTAYADKISDLTNKLTQNRRIHFAIVMCDIDNLKKINDSFGHEAGDEYIRNASRIICNTFVHSPVFRIGGDEFVAILEGDDYDNRDVLINELATQEQKARSIKDVHNGRAAFSFGMATYNRKKDQMVSDVVKAADREMYKIKNIRHSVR